MRSFTSITVCATFAALVSAVPFGNPPFEKRQSNTDPNGTCGGSTGFVCAAGKCCSSAGFCGVGEEYCGSGTASIGVPLQTSAAPTLSASSSAPTATATPTSNNTSTNTGGGSGSDKYTFYQGNGESSAGWPTQDKWVGDFDTMFSAQSPIIGQCMDGIAANSQSETQAIHDSINSVSQSTGVDPRFILAVVMQESKGCVRVQTTNYGVRNPGLMQDHDGAGTCNDAGTIQNPCPDSEITQMIQDGSGGTSQGDGLKQVLAQAPDANNQSEQAAKYYQAARLYNSGSIAQGGDLGAGIATHCYSSDIANRLTGWVQAPSTCTLDGSTG